MKVTYSPADGDVQVWQFNPDDVAQSQAEMVEKRMGAGTTWDGFLVAVRQGQARARRVLLWHLLRQTHHTLRFEDVPDFKMGQVKVEHDVDELLEIRDRVEKSAMSDEEKEGVLALLDVEITDAMGDPGKAEPDTAESSTSAPA